jgi:ABC-type uncharacterized transport system auxiliary subunit
LAVHWLATGNPQVVVGLGNSSVQYYNGSGWSQLQGTGWDTDVSCLQATWPGSGNPLVLVGLGDGSVQSYNGSSWTQLQGTGWSSAVTCAAAEWTPQ